MNVSCFDSMKSSKDRFDDPNSSESFAALSNALYIVSFDEPNSSEILSS